MRGKERFRDDESYGDGVELRRRRNKRRQYCHARLGRDLAFMIAGSAGLLCCKCTGGAQVLLPERNSKGTMLVLVLMRVLLCHCLLTYALG